VRANTTNHTGLLINIMETYLDKYGHQGFII